MKRLTPYVVGLFGGAAIAMMLCAGNAGAGTCEKWAGKVVSAEGIVEVKPAGETRWQAVKLNETYCPGDTIRTDRKSRADIALQNHPVIRLDQNTTVTLGGMKDERTSLVDMLSGAALFFSRVTRNLEVRTATVNAGVEGTEFFIQVEEGKTDLTVFEGKVLASNAAGGLPVTSGQSAVAEAGKAPVYRIIVRPRDAVQWALYYPPVLGPPPSGLKEETNDPRFHTHRASQFLAVGRVDEAKEDIDKALKLDPKNSDAFALLSIIAVAQNDKAKALDFARQAVAADPKSAAARIALSYAQQASFDLQGALNSLEEAVKLAPDDALAWARLAELQQSFGYLDKSLDSAKKAAGLRPDLSRTQTVLGFAYLTEVNIQEAMKAFGKAIMLDQADPLPRLGLGLAEIREGRLEDGRREFEVAVTLDPNNSITRSYLGKAYYEEKRDKLASGQYDMAKTLDPSDPTPYFYEAIEKQTTNRPVEALHELEKSIELNDNRAVYRSRLLLDSDLAARSASIARIYSDLGFQQRALVEGWKSVNTDPSDFSGHRFLADSYSALPRQEIARVSELLQSQLLQPINITPVQPGLAESNLFLIASSGAANLSFNEFNPLFNRDRVALQATGLVGGNDTWGTEGVVSGIYKKFSFSTGYSHFATDGFRPNNDQRDNIANVFAQWELSPKTSVQAEYRYRNNDRGDTQLRFFSDDFRPDRSQETKTNTVRAGFRQTFSPSSILIGNFAYQKLTDSFYDFGFIDPADIGAPLPPPPPYIRSDLGLNTDQNGYTGELSHLFRSQYVNTVAGAGYVRVNQEVIQGTLLTYPGNPDFGIPPITADNTTTDTDSDIDHFNLYLYAYIKPLNNLTLLAGASGDFFRYDQKQNDFNDLDKNQFNPKFGVTWNPLVGTTVRGAVFRTFKRTLLTNQTLEPTQVAGFNQFYDDFNATEAWVYGAAVDQKFSQNLFGGAEFTKRDLQVPWFDIPDPPAPPVPQLKEADWKEYMARAYFNWAPHRWFALKAEYRYEKFERDSDFNFNVHNVRTNSVPLGVVFSHPSGLNVVLGATYYDQSGEFMREGPIPVPYEDGSDNFWLVNAAVNYRLPKRYGFVTLAVTNLFDQKFQYYDTDINNPKIQPDRVFICKLTLAIP
jgi:tetratricopeptide (TPR) repeat protein